MELDGLTSNRTVQVGLSEDGAVQLSLDALVIEMSPANYRQFVDYLQRSLVLTESIVPVNPRPRLRLLKDEDD